MKIRIQQLAFLIIVIVGMLCFGIYQIQPSSDPNPPIQQEEFGDITKEEYLELARDLMDRTASYVVSKKEGGDTLFYDPKTNSFGVLSKDGYIRTFFKPSDGKNYYDRQ